MVSQPQGRAHDAYGDEWAQLQTSLHTRSAISMLRSASMSIEEAVGSAPHRANGFGIALELVQDATAILGRIDAEVHAEQELQAG